MQVFRGRVRKQFIWKYGLREIDGPVLNDHIVWKVETRGSVWNPEVPDAELHALKNEHLGAS
jgi:hypothetical protein